MNGIVKNEDPNVKTDLHYFVALASLPQHSGCSGKAVLYPLVTHLRAGAAFLADNCRTPVDAKTEHE